MTVSSTAGVLLVPLLVSAAVCPCVTAGAIHGRGVRWTTLAEARPIVAALGDSAPPALRGAARSGDDARWLEWLEARDADIRRRIATGDEDSVINLMLYGTGFTRQPRATGAVAASAPNGRVDGVMDGRLADLVEAIESPGADERLRFARQVVERHGIAVGAFVARGDATIPAGGALACAGGERPIHASARGGAAERIRRSSARCMRRSIATADSRPIRRCESTSPSSRLSSAVRGMGEPAQRRLDRVGIVGPGLDFVDKAQGYDLYPVQTIQPFALADSLRRLDISRRPVLTTLDISPRVMAHLRDARRRATTRQPYRLSVAIEQDIADSRPDPAMVEYWRRFGDRIGTPTTSDIPDCVREPRARALRGRPAGGRCAISPGSS